MATSHRSLCWRFAAAVCFVYGAAGTASAADRFSAEAPPLVVAQADQDVPADDTQSASALLIRITRLEDQLRSMTGQIEQLQFQNRKLEDALRKMQQDVDFRFQDLSRGARPVPQKRSDAAEPGDAGGLRAALPAVADAESATPATAPKPGRRTGDAFDPAADPNAPGAPKPLGTTPASEPLPPRIATLSGGPPHAPLDLMPNAVGAPPPPQLTPPEPPVGTDAAAASRPTPSPNSVASLTPGGTRGEFESDFALFKGGQYDSAATGFEGFVSKYPKDRLTADATYFLGESYARLGRQREAAEQFLKVSTDYTRSSHAPDALLKLGIALNALGAKEQACATYQEVDRKFPTASPDVRAGVERELKRSKC